MGTTLRKLMIGAAGLAIVAPTLALTPAGSALSETMKPRPTAGERVAKEQMSDSKNVGTVVDERDGSRHTSRQLQLDGFSAVATAPAAELSAINNGTEDSGNAFPYVVRLQGLGASCSGIMITPRWVLTAAHCLWGHSGATECGDPEEVFVDSAPGWIPSGWNPGVADVTLVSPTLNPPPKVDLMESLGGTLNACTKNSRSLDWALLHLDRRVAFSETNRFHPPVIQEKPTCVMDAEFRGVIVGYGPTSLSSSTAGIKHFGFDDDWERDPSDTGAEYWTAWFVGIPGITLGSLPFIDLIYDGMNPGDSGGPLLQVDGLDQPTAICGAASSPFVTVVPTLGIDIGNSYAAVDTQEATQFIEARILASFPQNPKIDGWYEGECRPPDENADADGDADGIPDACDSCPVNANPDQANFDFQDDGIGDACDDSDNDGLVDGDELNIYGTDPLNSDTDGDELSDGDEINKHGTDPLDSDTDDDELNDGLEIKYGTNPIDSDTDNDGLLDGEDVDFVKAAINGLPSSSFSPPGEGTRNAILVQLGSIEALLLAGKADQAIQQLTILRKHMDGCGTAADGNDWIVTCPEQLKIRALVDLLIANLSN